MVGFNFAALENAIGYTFKDKSLLLEALTHPSHSGVENYERLEFLGDAVLELCTSLQLYGAYPAAKEGELTKRRAAMVCSLSLMRSAQKINLGEYILMGRGEEATDGRKKRSVLENAMEALLGAVFLDGGLDAARSATRKLVMEGGVRHAGQPGKTVPGRDYKSLLQETVQAQGGKKILYETYKTEGPPHDSIFHVRLTVGGKPAGSGQGKSKKEAEQQAAKKALDDLYKINFKE